ncbi:hypothetical protein NE865_00509 [Phthorimaea operculella]|nr:hypothetical protein NE865_00509 [Phthorimaea operculella]
MGLSYVGVLLVWSCIFVSTPSEITVRKAGWLDRVVEFYKQRFIADVQEKLPPIEFKAEIVKAPVGYVDSKKWDYASVKRLLKLIRSSEKTKPLAKALRRALHPKTRRTFKGSNKQKSYKNFPKYPSKSVNIFYYDSYYDEYGAGSDDEDSDYSCTNDTLDDESIVTISNPVESRLPSAHISVRMLREVLEARAAAARVMPSTRSSTIYWKPMDPTKRATKKSGDATTANSTSVDDNGTNAEDNSTDAGTEAAGTKDETTPPESGNTTETLGVKWRRPGSGLAPVQGLNEFESTVK